MNRLGVKKKKKKNRLVLMNRADCSETWECSPLIIPAWQLSLTFNFYDESLCLAHLLYLYLYILACKTIGQWVIQLKVWLCVPATRNINSEQCLKSIICDYILLPLLTATPESQTWSHFISPQGSLILPLGLVYPIGLLYWGCNSNILQCVCESAYN